MVENEINPWLGMIAYKPSLVTCLRRLRFTFSDVELNLQWDARAVKKLPRNMRSPVNGVGNVRKAV